MQKKTETIKFKFDAELPEKLDVLANKIETSFPGVADLSDVTDLDAIHSFTQEFCNEFDFTALNTQLNNNIQFIDALPSAGVFDPYYEDSGTFKADSATTSAVIARYGRGLNHISFGGQDGKIFFVRNVDLQKVENLSSTSPRVLGPVKQSPRFFDEEEEAKKGQGLAPQWLIEARQTVEADLPTLGEEAAIIPDSPVDLTKITPLAEMWRSQPDDQACQWFHQGKDVQESSVSGAIKIEPAPDNSVNHYIKTIIRLADPLTVIFSVYWGCALFNQKMKALALQQPIPQEQYDQILVEGQRLLSKVQAMRGDSIPTLRKAYIDAVSNDPIFFVRHPDMATTKVSVVIPAAKLTEDERKLLVSSTLVAQDDNPIPKVKPAFSATIFRNGDSVAIISNPKELQATAASDPSLAQLNSFLDKEYFLNPLIKQLADQGLEIKSACYQQINWIKESDDVYRLQVLCHITETAVSVENDGKAKDDEGATAKPDHKSFAAPLITVRADYRLSLKKQQDEAISVVPEVLAYGIAQHEVQPALAAKEGQIAVDGTGNPNQSVKSDPVSALKASDLLSAETQRAYYRAMHTGQSRRAVAIPAMATALVVGALIVLAAFGILPVPDLTTWFRTLDMAFQIVIALFTPLVAGCTVGGIGAGIEYLVSRNKGSTYLDADDFVERSLVAGMKIPSAVTLVISDSVAPNLKNGSGNDSDHTQYTDTESPSASSKDESADTAGTDRSEDSNLDDDLGEEVATPEEKLGPNVNADNPSVALTETIAKVKAEVPTVLDIIGRDGHTSPTAFLVVQVQPVTVKGATLVTDSLEEATYKKDNENPKEDGEGQPVVLN